MKVNSTTYEFLRETMESAGLELTKRFGQNIKVQMKRDTSLVTEADLASEKVIIDRIKRYFPEDEILSEEAGLSSTDRQPGSHIWIIDPLDGTTNFANAYPFYCISIGRGRFRSDGSVEMVAGAVHDVARGRMYHAELGRGAYVGEQPIRVSAARDFQRCFLVTGFYYMKGPQLTAEIERFARIADQCQSIRRDGAAALDLALVAEGVFDCFWELGLQPWDVAAGSLIVSEAGGLVRNYQEDKPNRYNIEGIGIVAGSPTAAASVTSFLV